MEAWRVFSPVFADSNHVDEEQAPDTDPHRSKKLDPDSYPHLSEKLNPDPH
jgi:hypothetical protein